MVFLCVLRRIIHDYNSVVLNRWSAKGTSKAGVSTDPLGVYSEHGQSLITEKFDYLPNQEGHRMEIRHFTECIEKNLPVRVQPQESLQIQKSIDSIYKSSVKNMEIVIKV